MTIEPVELPLVIHQGQTIEEQWTLYDAAGDEWDISAYSARAQFRETHNSEDAIVTWSTDDDTITLGAGGTIELNSTKAVTAAIETLKGVWDFFLYAPGGEPAYKVFYGSVTVIEDVTHA